MRKVLSVVLAATMAMSLAACGGSGAKTDTKAADAGTAAGDEASADDYYITIKFSNVFQPAEWNYKASEYLADLVKEKTDESHVGYVTLGRGALKPGLGVCKELHAVGDLFITGIVAGCSHYDPMMLQSIRLALVMQLADCISAGIGLVENFCLDAASV